MHKPTAQNLRAAFTLIELLIAVVVVAILGSLVFSVSANVRANADALSCTARMRALAQSVLAYSVDHQGVFPKSGHSGHSWAASVAPYLGEPSLSQPLDYRMREPFRCPSQSSDDEGWGYGLNVFFELSDEVRYTPAGLPILGSRDVYAGSPKTWHRPIDVPWPNRTVLLAENPHRTADHFMAHQWSSPGAARSGVAHNRHDGASNYAFVDGHIEMLRVEEIYAPATQTNRWNPSLAYR